MDEKRHADIQTGAFTSKDLLCPNCQSPLVEQGESLPCHTCGQVYRIEDGIPQLFWENDWEAGKKDVTDIIKRFYEETPFPDYEEFDSPSNLIDKASKGVFARLLDEQIPPGSDILECGCGTGQLSAFLSIRNRNVVGTDMCMNSLRLGQAFKARHGLGRVSFIQMNLFRPVFADGTFDLVISNGVLHHTSDPKRAFETIAKLVKPGRFIIIGLYHRDGRLLTNLRQRLFRLSGERFSWLDPYLKEVSAKEAKKEAWLNDQYRNPHESSHTITEVIPWFDEAGFDVLTTIPRTTLGRRFSESDKLFTQNDLGRPWERSLIERGMLLHGTENGFFVVIGRRRG
jgi:SAM-dependent methyltransferase